MGLWGRLLRNRPLIMLIASTSIDPFRFFPSRNGTIQSRDGSGVTVPFLPVFYIDAYDSVEKFNPGDFEIGMIIAPYLHDI